jgi:cytochrome c peroxidase
MKKKSVLLLLCFFAACACLIQCTHKNDQQQWGIADSIKQKNLKNIIFLDSLLRQTEIVMQSGGNNFAMIRQLFLQSRLAYKRIQYMAEFYHPGACEQINGPAIFKAEEDAPDKILEPTGFQKIEELLYTDKDSIVHPDLSALYGVLRSDLKRIRLLTENTVFTDPNIFEAIRLEAARISTLGIAGADSPLAQYSCAEIAEQLLELHDILGLYVYRSGKGDALLTIIKSAARYFKESEFNSFDRAEAITTFLNPISTGILELRDQLGIKAPASVSALRPGARHIFEENALDPDFFAPSSSHNLPEGAAKLGEKLFFEKKLSGDEAFSCATCHQPDKAFTDGLEKSAGRNGVLERNTPTIINSAMQRALFHDGRVVFLEDQTRSVFNSADEFHFSFAQAITKLNADPAYVNAFKSVFPDGLNQDNLRRAIAAYERTLIGFNSRFDQAMRSTDAALLSPQEKAGFNLYMGKARCGTCHFLPLTNGTIPPTFTRSETEVLGTPVRPAIAQIDPDKGRYSVIPAQPLLYSFKTPTVRNIQYTAPYMHNGAFASLDQVIDFYNHGGGTGMGIRLDYQTLPPDSLHLSDSEKKSLIAFLQSMADTTTRYSKK